MKKFWNIALAMVLMTSSALAFEYNLSPSCELAQDQLEVVDIFQIDQEALNGVMAGLHPDLALLISSHHELPLYLLLSGDFLDLQENSNLSITTQRDIYMRVVNENYWFSCDGTTWKSLSEMVTGKAFLALSVNEIGAPFVTAGAEIYERT